MSDIKLSATRINTFLQCKLRYKYNYIDKLEKLSNPAFKLGLACHTALEYAGKLWKDNNLTYFTEDQIKEVLDVYSDKAIEEGLEEYSSFVEGKEMLKHKLLNFAVGERILDLEISFGFEDGSDIYTSTGVPLIGAIDKVVEINESTLMIVDYKTSMTIPDSDKLKTDIQLSMYNLVANQIYPNYDRVILCLDMLRKNEMVYTYRTKQELDEFENYLKVIYDKMVEFDPTTAEPNLNMLCGWCDYRNICPKYNEVCSNKKYEFMQINDMSNEDLVAEWEHIKTIKKLLETRESELSAAIIDKIKVMETSVDNGEVELYLRQNARTNYKPHVLAKYIPYEDFVDFASISPTKFKKYINKNPKLKSIVEEASETNFTNAFLAKRKIKKK